MNLGARARSSQILWLAAALAGIHTLQFLPAASIGFHWDDFFTLYIARELNGSWLDSFRPIGNGFWRPVNMLLVHVGDALFGENPLGYHLIASAFHLLATVTVWVVGARFLGSLVWGWIAAVLFSLNFAHWDVVIWPAAVGDTALCAAAMLCIWSFDRFLEGRGATWYCLALIAAMLALMAKETGVVVPGLLLPLVFVDLRGGACAWRFSRRAALGWAPFLLIALAYLVWFALRMKGTDQSLEAQGWISPVGRHVPRNLIDYAACLVLPWLYVGAPPWAPGFIPSQTLLWSVRLVFVVTVLAATLWCWRRRDWRPLLFAAWIIVALLPGSTHRGGVMPRHTYLASAAFGILLADLCARWWSRRALSHAAQRAVRVGVVAGVASLSALWLWSQWSSPAVGEFRRESALCHHLWQQMRAWAGGLPDGAQVALVDFPLDRPPEMRRQMGDILLRLSAPGKTLWAIPLDSAALAAGSLPPLAPGTRIFVYRDGRFREIASLREALPAPLRPPSPSGESSGGGRSAS
jgi:hypothetical protein